MEKLTLGKLELMEQLMNLITEQQELLMELDREYRKASEFTVLLEAELMTLLKQNSELLNLNEELQQQNRQLTELKQK